MSFLLNLFNSAQKPLNRLAFGDSDRFRQQGTQNPQQQQYMQQLFSGLQGGQSNIPGMEYLQSILSNDPEAFRDFERPAMRQFNEQIIPNIAERFSALGSGSRNSSAFNNATAMAGSRLSENLSGQRANLRSNAVNQFQNYGQMGMQPSFENLFSPGRGGLLNGPGGSGIVQLLLSLLGGGG